MSIGVLLGVQLTPQQLCHKSAIFLFIIIRWCTYLCRGTFGFRVVRHLKTMAHGQQTSFASHSTCKIHSFESSSWTRNMPHGLLWPYPHFWHIRISFKPMTPLWCLPSDGIETTMYYRHCAVCASPRSPRRCYTAIADAAYGQSQSCDGLIFDGSGESYRWTFHRSSRKSHGREATSS